MKLHWKVLAWMVAGLVLGLFMQWKLDAAAWTGGTFVQQESGISLSSAPGGSPAGKSKLAVSETVNAVILNRGKAEQEDGSGERRVTLASPADWQAVLEASSNGQVVWFVRASDPEAEDPVAMTLGMDPASARARWIYPFSFVADIFLALLKMLIVPLVLSSIVTGVASVGSLKDLRRLGGKTFAYYMSTSLLAILVGQTLVNLIRPGEGAELGLSALQKGGAGTDESFLEVIKRMVPSNVIEAMSSNGNMLQIIFFALLFGFFITRTAAPHGTRMRELFESLLEVMMSMAKGVLTLLPYGVFALIVKVVAATGFSVFKPLGLYMITVASALVLHSCVTLPIVLKVVGGISPLAWFKAMSPAIMTAFSTSSSSMTLPVTMETVEKRGRVSNKITSFTLPLGATINMDGTALYECIGVIFLAQYYATIPGSGFELTMGDQGLVVMLALLASVGAAGIPSAGLVMMLTILAALDLPVEGAALLLAVDRPLDMMRTMVNVWSDSCGAAVIASSEGELGPRQLAELGPGGGGAAAD